MPIYEYRCKSCGREFEVIQKFSDGPVKECTGCKSGDVERLISSSSFHLKGSGWYKTDYAGKEKKESKNETPECAACPSSCPAE